MILGLWSVRIKCLFKVPGLQDSVVVALRDRWVGTEMSLTEGPVAWLLVVGLGGRTLGRFLGHSTTTLFAYPNV